MAQAAQPASESQRWVQLICGVVCMAMIANLQYGWTLFVDPIEAKHQWGRAAIQLAFTIFVLTETWLVPVEAWFVDRYGPRVVLMFGAVMIALAWSLNSIASSLFVLYAASVVAGIGAGAVYGTCVGNALKWFPTIAASRPVSPRPASAQGAAITVVPIAQMIASHGYETAFLTFGIGQGVVVFVLSFFIRKPPAVMAPPKKVSRLPQSKISYAPRQTLSKPIFWLLYAMFVMVASGGLMAAAQIAPIAHDFKVADVPVTLLGVQMAALTFAISLDRVFDGFGRPFFGWVSDNIGRENTMFIAFAVAAGSLAMLVYQGQNPYVFVIFSALFFGVFGEIYSLFPATCGDTFGSKFAATNAGMLYTAKGTAALLVPLASLIAVRYGWSAVFAIAMTLNIVAAFLAMFVLKPWRSRFLARSAVEAEAEERNAAAWKASEAAH